MSSLNTADETTRTAYIERCRSILKENEDVYETNFGDEKWSITEGDEDEIIAKAHRRHFGRIVREYREIHECWNHDIVDGKIIIGTIRDCSKRSEYDDGFMSCCGKLYAEYYDESYYQHISEYGGEFSLDTKATDFIFFGRI